MKTTIKQLMAIHEKGPVLTLKAFLSAGFLALLFWAVQGAGGSPWLSFDSVSALVASLVKYKLVSTLAITAGGCFFAELVKGLIDCESGS
ncbi:hypothetical protein [Marinobacter sp. S6332]|uniref:hypothetical protein n=1 Tax=Marinobacter sp. S6332 TaxID=2926403 RepID=UPI001FF6C2CA|nr:hypothetical protein [Marinobacter sp. S6332]MCK0165806.1 hypothetical protein [Marinobacter sp. S6332]